MAQAYWTVRVTTQTGEVSIIPMYYLVHHLVKEVLQLFVNPRQTSDHSDPEILSEKVSAHRIKATLGITGL
jgi:hypothetical protein